MSRQVTVTIHSIAEDGYPPHTDDMTGRVAFLFDGCIVSGWPLHADPTDYATPYTGRWEADSDVGHNQPFSGVTHWVEFPEPVWAYEKPQPAGGPQSDDGRYVYLVVDPQGGTVQAFPRDRAYEYAANTGGVVARAEVVETTNG